MGGGEYLFSFFLFFAACSHLMLRDFEWLLIFLFFFVIVKISSHKLRQSIVLTWEETVKLGEPVLEAVQKRASDLRNLAEQIPP